MRKDKLRNPLMDEFYRYESDNQLTKDERKALLEWVKEGNSVHDNPSLAEDGHGSYLDFIDVYRYEEEIRKKLDALPEHDRENYLARLRGEDTIDNLREDLSQAYFKLQIYEKVIKKHHLEAEVNLYINEANAESERISELLKTLSYEELPFN